MSMRSLEAGPRDLEANGPGMVKVAAVPVPVVGVMLNSSTGIPTQWGRGHSSGKRGVGKNSETREW